MDLNTTIDTHTDLDALQSTLEHYIKGEIPYHEVEITPWPSYIVITVFGKEGETLVKMVVSYYGGGTTIAEVVRYLIYNAG